MGFPSMKDGKEFGSSNVPSEGRHDVSLKSMEYSKSKAGNDMLVAQLVIDNGPDQRKELTEYLVMGTEYNIGEDRLYSYASNAQNAEFDDGFQYTSDVSSWDEFAAQFERSTPLRFSIDVVHEYSIETDRGWKNDVSKEVRDEHVEGGGKSRTSAKVIGYYQPVDKSGLPNLKPGSSEEPSEDNGFPEHPGASGDGAPGAQAAPASSDEDDDGLPF